MFSEQIGRAMPDIWFTVLHSTSWAFCPVQRPGSHLYSRCLWCHVATVTKWYVETCHLRRIRVIHLMCCSSAVVWTCPICKINRELGAVSIATLVTTEKVNTVTHPAVQGLKGSADISIKRNQINQNGKPKAKGAMRLLMIFSRSVPLAHNHFCV